MAGHADAELNLLERLLVAQDDARHNLGRGRVKSVFRRLHVLKVLGHEIDEGRMFEVAGGGDDDVAGSKAVGVGIEHGLPLKTLHGLLGAENRLAQGMILPEILREDLVDEVIRIVLIHLDLFDDDAAFARDVGGIKHRMQHQIAEDLKRDGDVLVEHLDVEADAFFGGEGVHVAADGVDLARNFFRGAVLGAFEDHVLDEVGDAVPVGILIARTGLQPDSDRGRADVLHLLSNHG